MVGQDATELPILAFSVLIGASVFAALLVHDVNEGVQLALNLGHRLLVVGQELVVTAHLAAQANSGVCQTSYEAVVLRHYALYTVQTCFRLGEARVCLGEVCFEAGLVRFEAGLLLKHEFHCLIEVQFPLPRQCLQSSPARRRSIIARRYWMRHLQRAWWQTSSHAALRNKVLVHPCQDQPAHFRQLHVGAVKQLDAAVSLAAVLAI